MDNPNIIKFYKHPLHYEITPALPPFFCFERTVFDEVIRITGPNLGWVTVDFGTRSFALGAKDCALPVRGRAYKGQGWWQRLVNDAVRVLRQTEK